MNRVLPRLAVLSVCLMSSAQVMGAGCQAGTPSLKRFITERLAEMPAIRALDARIEAARARLRAARQPRYNPEISVDSERTDVTSKSIGITQTIDWSGQRRWQTEIARHQLRAAEYERIRERQRLIADWLLRLGEVRYRKSLLQIAESRLKMLKVIHRLSLRRRQAGDINRSDLNQAFLAMQQASFALSRARADYFAATQSLQALAPVNLACLPGLPDRLDQGKPAPGGVIIEHLPVMQALRSRIDAARATLRIQVARKSSDPSIGVRLGREGRDNLVAIELSVPWKIRNTGQAEVDEANAELVRLQREYLQQQRARRSRLVALAQQYSVALQAWAAWRKRVWPTLVGQTNLLQKRWKTGDVGVTELLLQLQQVVDAREAGVGLERQAWREGVAWLRATSRLDKWRNEK